jgi:hypothetical protein
MTCWKVLLSHIAGFAAINATLGPNSGTAALMSRTASTTTATTGRAIIPDFKGYVPVKNGDFPGKKKKTLFESTTCSGSLLERPRMMSLSP